MTSPPSLATSSLTIASTSRSRVAPRAAAMPAHQARVPPPSPRSSTTHPSASMPVRIARSIPKSSFSRRCRSPLRGSTGGTSIKSRRSRRATSVSSRATASFPPAPTSSPRTRSSAHRIARRRDGSRERSGNRHGSLCHCPVASDSVRYRGQSIRPLGALLCSSSTSSPRPRFLRSSPSLAKTGPARTQGGISRALPGTNGRSRNSGAEDHPVCLITWPMPAQPNLGSTMSPAAMPPVCAERSGMAPVQPPGVSSIVGSGEPGTI